MDAGLTTIAEADIEKHRATAQSMITRVVVLECAPGQSRHGAGRHGPPLRLDRLRRLAEQDPRGRADEDRRLRPARRPASSHRASTRCSTARGAASRWLSRSPMSSPAAASSKAWQPRMPARRSKATTQRASRSCSLRRPMWRPLLSPPISCQLIDADGEAPNDISEPDFLFDTPQDALKSMVAGLDGALSGAKADADLMPRAKTFARVAIDGPADAKRPLRRSRQLRGRAYPHRRRRFHARRFRRRAGPPSPSRW